LREEGGVRRKREREERGERGVIPWYVGVGGCIKA
jgi:hypothetical protein